MEPTDEVFIELVRQLRSTAQLRHSWTARSLYARGGLHPASAWLLGEINRRGESRMSDLAKGRMVDLSVVSRQVAQLAEAGMVERRPAPDDGRVALLRVSERGEAELAAWRADQVELLRRALGGWEADELATVTERLRAINDDLRTFMDVHEGAACDEILEDRARPDSAGSTGAQPDGARSDSARSDGARSDSAQPDSARSDSAQPDSAQPDSAQPTAAGK